MKKYPGKHWKLRSRKARSMTDGHLAVNIMGVLSNADDLVKTAVQEGIKIIVFGAGLPTKLPALVAGSGCKPCAHHQF